MVTAQQKAELVQAAREAAEQAYAPYSRFRVGAALLGEDGTIYRGVNVENRSYGLTICAERSAVATAVSAGGRTFLALAIYSPEHEGPLAPCGACRQVLSEFGNRELLVIMAGTRENKERLLSELLPLDMLHELKDSPE